MMDASSRLREFYPPVNPFNHGALQVSDVHELYWEQSGNPAGVPVVFLHGGPGGGCNSSHRRFFDPNHYRIILFDQRGCGRSKPFAEVKDNTTNSLVSDLEQLRRHLVIDKWIVFGGSWGSTLALAYGTTFPGSCLGFVLRGVFLARPEELDWFLYGMQTIFPEAFNAFKAALPEEEHDNLLGNFYRRLMDPEATVNLPAANAWNKYESECSQLIPARSTGVMGSAGLALARIEAHYFINDMFLSDSPLLNRLNKVIHLPCTIVQGRYDMVCPMKSAFDLHENWPGSTLDVVADAGHSAMEPGTKSALINAMESFKSL